MSCGCNNFEQISNCGDFANRADVIAALESIDSSCCVGEVMVIEESPCSSDAAAQSNVLEAFPDGVVDCQCPCVYIWNDTTKTLSQNCSGDLSLSDNWICSDSSRSCLGGLTTAGLSPSTDEASRLASIDEAYPEGIPETCTGLAMVLEDGSTCTSNDGGATWSCASGAVGLYMRASQPTQNSSIIPRGVFVNFPLAIYDNRAGFVINGNNEVVIPTVPTDSLATFTFSTRVCRSGLATHAFSCANVMRYRFNGVAFGGYSSSHRDRTQYVDGAVPCLDAFHLNAQFVVNTGDRIGIEFLLSTCNNGAQTGNSASMIFRGGGGLGTGTDLEVTILGSL